ncbi:ribonuclease HII [Croceiramulus getboli]|nr:ribonuclease HII [Flavobacteriaceae bacterium YJPT1-3]
MLAVHYHDSLLECGVDEAGRGCLAGPVTAAAVILPADFSHPFLNDSKQLSATKREELVPIIKKEAVAYHIEHVFMEEIQSLNILWAAIEAMHRCIQQLPVQPEHIAVDGNRFKPYPNIPHQCIIKGDGKYLNIAAASILAKTERDAFMLAIDQEYPAYDWKHNKGYPTAKHRQALRKHGSTPYHRQGFKLLPEQFKLPL